MKTRVIGFVFLFVLQIAPGLAAEVPAARELYSAIIGADSVELVRLNPSQRNIFGQKRSNDASGTIDGRKIVSARVAKDRADILRLAASLQKSVEKADPELIAMCFNPRHALRLRSGSTESVIVVCFECLGGYSRGISGASSFHLEGTAESEWEDVFAKNGISRIKKG